MTITDHYSVFEDEPELQLSYSNKTDTALLKIWIVYFDQIMEQVAPSLEGWTSLAYYYHLNSGWYEEENWAIPNTAEAIEQLKSFSPCEDDKVEAVRRELIIFLSEAVGMEVPVSMTYY